ncbi:MAG TPA: hypothetical protein VIX58_10045 [Anaerolineae bacterium]
MRHPSLGDIVMSYSQILRTIGAYIDKAGLSEVRIIETDEGMILQGLVMQGDRAGQRDTYQLTSADIENLVQDAFAERGKRLS